MISSRYNAHKLHCIPPVLISRLYIHTFVIQNRIQYKYFSDFLLLLITDLELLNDAKSKIQSLETLCNNNEKSNIAQVEQLRETIADRDRILRETVQEQQNVIAERNTLNEMLQQQQEYVDCSDILVLYCYFVK